MPYKKRPSTRRRRPTRKPTRSTKPNRNNLRTLNPYGVKSDPFPTRMNTRMKATINTLFTTSALGGAYENVFRLNSIYDPDFTVGVGSSTAVGHPEMATLYRKYKVNAVKVRISFNNPSADSLRVGYSLNQGTSISGLIFDNIMEKPLTYCHGLNNTGSQCKNFEIFIKPWQLIGISKLEYESNSDKYTALMSANPTASCYLRVFACSDNGTVGTTVRALTKIIYYVTLWDRIALTTSLF